VNIYASGEPAISKLRGNHENTEIGHFIEEYLELDLDVITGLLNARYATFQSFVNVRGDSWMHGDAKETLLFKEEFGKRYLEEQR
jgi:alkaline phosphatase